MSLTTKTYTYKTQPTPASEPILASVHFLPTYTGPHAVSRPIALFYHGGGFIIGHKDVIPQAQIDFLARDHGFVVVSADYRLCPQVTLLEGPVVDAADAYKWCREVLPGLLEKEGIMVDEGRIGVLGHSAGGMLATLTAFLPNPPNAIVDFYGSKYLRDPWWALPNASKAMIPDFPPEFTNQVFSSPSIPSSIPILGPTHPDFEMTPRLAYLLGGVKDGTSMSRIMPDAQYDLVDPSVQWNAGKVDAGKTKVCFVHGESDELVPWELAEKAVRELKGLGVEAELVSVPGALHAFDMFMKEKGGENWEYVERALSWLVERV